MKKLMLILVLMVVVVGCDKFSQQDGPRTPTSIDYRHGTGGLEIEVLEGLPPKEIFEGGTFKIGLRLKNTGAYDIKRGTIEVAGFDEKYLVVSEAQKNLEEIEGKSITNPEGGFYIEEFDGVTMKSLGKAKEYLVNYYIVSRYDYRSEAQAEVCVNTNLYSGLKLMEESCKPEQRISLNGQGSPVAISKIEQVIVPEGQGAKIVFKIYVTNSGKGKLVSPIYLEEAKLANRRLSCEPNFLDLQKETKESKVFVCTAQESGPASYVTPFYTAIYYTYQIQEKKSFKIKSIQV